MAVLSSGKRTSLFIGKMHYKIQQRRDFMSTTLSQKIQNKSYLYSTCNLSEFISTNKQIKCSKTPYCNPNPIRAGNYHVPKQTRGMHALWGKHTETLPVERPSTREQVRRKTARSFLGGSAAGKQSTCQHRGCRFDPWIRKIP